MFPRSTLFGRLTIAGFALASVVRLGAQLTTTSPFMPPASAGIPAPTAAAPLEYTGFIMTEEGVLYRVRDPQKKVGTWVKLNQRDEVFDVLAKQHDDSHNTLTLEHQGRTLTLQQKEAKIVSSGSAAMPVGAPPMPMAGQPMPAAVTQPVVLNPTPADEQRRLEAVAAEVARRRALREQAAQQQQQTNPAAGPQVVVPPPPNVQVPNRIRQQQR